jgi:hypothetical protein
MLLHPMMNFNLMKKIIFLCSHEHKSLKLNHFKSISKEPNFRVLQIVFIIHPYMKSIHHNTQGKRTNNSQMAFANANTASFGIP